MWIPDRSQRMPHDEYTTILREITNKLTGDWDRDRVFLNQMSEEYVHHRQGKEILRAIGRLIYTRMPEEFREEVGHIVHNDADYHQTVLAEVRHLIQERLIDEAKQLIDKIVPPEDLYAEDEVSIYYSFRNPVEEIFFEQRFAPEKTIRIPPFPFNEVYELLLYLQVEQMHLADAMETIAIALKRNPLNTTILFEAAELHKMRKELDEFLTATVKCHQFLYRRPDLARYFRNLGYCFIEKREWDEAIVSYCMSSQWHQTDMAQSQLYYIAQETGKLPEPEKYENWEQILTRHNVPVRPEVLWPQIAWGLGNHARESENCDLAAFSFSLVFELTRDEDAKRLLEECKVRLKDAP